MADPRTVERRAVVWEVLARASEPLAVEEILRELHDNRSAAISRYEFGPVLRAAAEAMGPPEIETALAYFLDRDQARFALRPCDRCAGECCDEPERTYEIAKRFRVAAEGAT